MTYITNHNGRFGPRHPRISVPLSLCLLCGEEAPNFSLHLNLVDRNITISHLPVVSLRMRRLWGQFTGLVLPESDRRKAIPGS